MTTAWRTYTPDGRELAVERDADGWSATCNGRRCVRSSAAEAIADAVVRDVSSIGSSEPIDAWVVTHAARIEAEAGA